MLLEKDHFKMILECIQKNFNNPDLFVAELKNIALKILNDTVYETAAIISFGEILFQMLHFEGISISFENTGSFISPVSPDSTKFLQRAFDLACCTLAEQHNCPNEILFPEFCSNEECVGKSRKEPVTNCWKILFYEKARKEAL
jgi:hypothetical protein